MNLHDYLRILRRGWWIILLSTLIGGVGGLAVTAASTPEYQAVSTVFVAASGTATPSDLQQGNVFSTQRATSYANLATTTVVLERAMASLDDDRTIDDLREDVSVVARVDTNLIDVFVVASQADQAADAANAIADALAVEVGNLDTPGNELAAVALTRVETAVPPTIAQTPQPRTNFLIGLFAGFAVGLAIVVSAHALDTRIRNGSDLPRVAGISTMTQLPYGRSRAGRTLAQNPARHEALRTLRANLQFGTKVGAVVAVTPVDSASDSNAISSDLAIAIGEIGARVVVIDADLRHSEAPAGRSRKSAETAAENTPGLADVLVGDAAIGDVVLPGPGDNVYLVGAGTVTPHSAQLLSTSTMTDALAFLGQHFDYVIVAGPALAERSEAAVLAALADNCLVVAESGVTRRATFLTARERLEGVGVSSLSVVIDGVRAGDARPIRAEPVPGAGVS